jgi:hypothetical protein
VQLYAFGAAVVAANMYPTKYIKNPKNKKET